MPHLHRLVGAEEEIKRLVAALREQQAEPAELGSAGAAKLEELGYGR